MGRWVIAENPAFAGQTPRPLKPACHDGSPFLTIRCGDCDSVMHLHETQLPVPAVPIGAPCRDCGELLEFDAGELEGAFARMRADGWIA